MFQYNLNKATMGIRRANRCLVSALLVHITKIGLPNVLSSKPLWGQYICFYMHLYCSQSKPN